METIAVYVIVGLAAVALLVRRFAHKASPGCDAGCDGCGAAQRRPALVTIKRRPRQP
jgi:hypothetical protein